MNSDETEIIKSFVSRARDISAHSVFTGGQQKLSYKMNFSAGQPPHDELKKPGQEAMVSLMTLVRPCWLQGDNLYFRRVYNITWRELQNSSENARTAAASAIDAFKQLETRTAIAMVINDKKLTPKEIVGLYFHGDVFHIDLDKRRTLQSLSQTPVAGLLDFEFYNFIIELGRLIVFFADIADQELLRGPGLRPATSP